MNNFVFAWAIGLKNEKQKKKEVDLTCVKGPREGKGRKERPNKTKGAVLDPLPTSQSSFVHWSAERRSLLLRQFTCILPDPFIYKKDACLPKADRKIIGQIQKLSEHVSMCSALMKGVANGSEMNPLVYTFTAIKKLSYMLNVIG